MNITVIAHAIAKTLGEIIGTNSLNGIAKD